MTANPALAARKTELWSAPHFVYRCFNAEGDIIYVGCTWNVEQRMAQHQATNIGAKTVRIDVTEHPDQRAALDIERSEIRRYEPFFNRQTWFMDVESWPRLKVLQRLWIDLALHESIPFLHDNSSPVSHLRNVFIEKFDEDPIYLVANVKKVILDGFTGAGAAPVVQLKLKSMQGYPTLSPAAFV